MGIGEKIVDTLINHHIEFEARLCSRFRTPKSGCSACADLCPAGVIQVSDKGAEIEVGCTDCGVCISACPNGAFKSSERSDGKIVNEIQRTIQRVKGSEGQRVKSFSISCEHGNAEAGLILPCLSRLTEAMLMEMVKSGASSVEILQPTCEWCPDRKAARHLNSVVQQALYIYEMLGIEKDSISVTSTKFNEEKNSQTSLGKTESESISRRAFLTGFRNKAVEVAAASIPLIDGKDNGNNKETFREVIQKTAENAKRMLLLDELKGVISATPELHSSLRKVEILSDDSPVAELEVNSRCTGCGVCAALCPTGSITQQNAGGKFALSYKPALCTNCKVCAAVCMTGAIEIKDKASLNILLEERDIKIFEADRKKCAVCKIDFIGGAGEICPLCVNIHEKQMSAIKTLFKKEV